LALHDLADQIHLFKKLSVRFLLLTTHVLHVLRGSLLGNFFIYVNQSGQEELLLMAWKVLVQSDKLDLRLRSDLPGRFTRRVYYHLTD